MEDVFKFLLVAAVVIIGIARQFKKEATKNADNGPVMTPNAERPLSENWDGGTYGGYIPEGPQSESATKAKAKTTSPPKPTPYVRQAIPAMASSLQEPEEPAESEFAIHSTEEARRAIVWSEILQRKY